MYEKQLGQRAIRPVRAQASDPLDLHHHTSQAKRFKFVVHAEYRLNKADPAYKDSIPKLQDDILGRIIGRDFDGDDHNDFTDEQRNSVIILRNQIHRSKTIRINYTTYDVRRDYDTIDHRLQPFVMVLSPVKETDPYWYAQVLGVFHATVYRDGGVKNPEWRTSPQRMVFLWVRWLGAEPGYRFGFKTARLLKVSTLDTGLRGWKDQCVAQHCISDCSPPSAGNGRVQTGNPTLLTSESEDTEMDADGESGVRSQLDGEDDDEVDDEVDDDDVEEDGGDNGEEQGGDDNDHNGEVDDHNAVPGLGFDNL
ncbi:unnamed protein product [Mycena citricolor]|uniref:Uncharacterized protein n=1 Tax=Mycena citricolor TaxID=2018698 RepID=A0AAD2JUE4_9AGAR|nr:unnamed protein product [Mycena citricolor]CAK5273338.1 unnamed protein product [Mycena citricolor]